MCELKVNTEKNPDDFRFAVGQDEPVTTHNGVCEVADLEIAYSYLTQFPNLFESMVDGRSAADLVPELNALPDQESEDEPVTTSTSTFIPPTPPDDDPDSEDGD